MKIALKDVLAKEPCEFGLENALPALRGLEFDLADPRIPLHHLRWLYHHDLITEGQYAELAQFPREDKPQIDVACLVVGYKPLTSDTIRLDPVAEEMIVRYACRYLTRRLEGGDRVFKTVGPSSDINSDRGPWTCGRGELAVWLRSEPDDSRETWILEYTCTFLDDELGTQRVHQLKNGRYSCPGYKLYDKQWWEIVAFHAGRMVTVDEALAELARTR